MNRLAAYAVALLTLLASPLSHAAWNADWTKHVKVGINTAADGLPVKAAAEGVPLLVRLHTGNFTFADAKPDGSDIRFVAADDKTPLKFHIEKYDAVNELALIWVQLPKLTPSSNADFVTMYFGNPNAAAGAEPKATYDAAQSLVWHFAEKEPLPQDSTANAVHAAKSTARSTPAGLVGGGVSFDGKAEITAASPALKTAGPRTVTMWIKPVALDDATLFAQDGAGGLQLQIKGGQLLAKAGPLAAPAGGKLVTGKWQHVAVVLKDGVAVYLDGAEVAKAAGGVPAADGAVTVGRGFRGDMDELEVASAARSAEWVQVAAGSQGIEQKLVNVVVGEGASESGPSVLRILLSAVTIDGWVVIGILMVMLVISFGVMITKTMFVVRTASANADFKARFAQLFDAVMPGAEAGQDEQAAQQQLGRASLWRLYEVGVAEMRSRFAHALKHGHAATLSDQSINAIRATIDARMVRETQSLNSRMVLLTISIAGGPFLGLLGTVVGVMITFAAIAAAGDVNVNAIAPGIAAALVATVAGLAVAIPALFGYNYLSSRISELNSDMQVFVDELIARIAEKHTA